jgi:hypothetical protein
MEIPMPKAKRAHSTPKPPRPTQTPPLGLQCEDEFYKIADSVSVLWFIWDSVANGTLESSKLIDSALNYILVPMDDAVQKLGVKLGLEVDRFDRYSEGEEDEARG